MQLTLKLKQRGFTLIEVLIALAIVGASMAVLWQLFASANGRVHQAADRAQLILAEKQLYQQIVTHNPRLETAAYGDIETWAYQWHSEKISADYSIFSEDRRIKVIALYRINLQLRSVRGRLYSLQWTQLGWENS
jgi:prepilin-type N-terminal cleavage/methylation domain-containing protein